VTARQREVVAGREQAVDLADAEWLDELRAEDGAHLLVRVDDRVHRVRRPDHDEVKARVHEHADPGGAWTRY